MRLELVRLDLSAIKDQMRIVGLQVEPKNSRQLLNRRLPIQPRWLLGETVDQDARTGWLVRMFGIRNLNVGELSQVQF